MRTMRQSDLPLLLQCCCQPLSASSATPQALQQEHSLGVQALNSSAQSLAGQPLSSRDRWLLAPTGTLCSLLALRGCPRCAGDLSQRCTIFQSL